LPPGEHRRHRHAELRRGPHDGSQSQVAVPAARLLLGPAPELHVQGERTASIAVQPRAVSNPAGSDDRGPAPERGRAHRREPPAHPPSPVPEIPQLEVHRVPELSPGALAGGRPAGGWIEVDAPAPEDPLRIVLTILDRG